MEVSHPVNDSIIQVFKKFRFLFATTVFIYAKGCTLLALLSLQLVSLKQ